eukprot:274723-Chlamydomonas_euryale.AAC.1
MLRTRHEFRQRLQHVALADAAAALRARRHTLARGAPALLRLLRLLLRLLRLLLWALRLLLRHVELGDDVDRRQRVRVKAGRARARHRQLRCAAQRG